MHRKSFLAQAGIILTGMPFASMAQNLDDDYATHYRSILNGKSASNTKTDEAYWNMVREMFKFSKEFINLENGYFSPQPMSTLQFHQSKEHEINSKSSWFMRREQHTALEHTRQNLAEFLGGPQEELAITRNTTESLNTIISGYPWQKGDEVIVGNQDYGSMLTAFRQQEKRAGIKLVMAQIPLHPKSDDDLVQAYMSLATPKTKVIHLTHMINLSGQLLPAKKIIGAAHAKGIEVMVDAAHSVAHIDFEPYDLGADYLAASLHKWLCCPLGLGVLIMQKKHISKIWPLMADDDFAIDNIRKFEHLGTRPPHSIFSINEAIRFHRAIGSTLKQDRLRYLKSYWVTKVKDLPHVSMNTPDDENRSGAIANIAIAGLTPQQLSDKLLADAKIFTVAIDHPFIKGVRITPHLYTSLADLDKLVEAIKKMA